MTVSLRRNPGDEFLNWLVLDADAACEVRGLNAAAGRLGVRVALALGIPRVQVRGTTASIAVGFCDPWCGGQTGGLRAEDSGDTGRGG